MTEKKIRKANESVPAELLEELAEVYRKTLASTMKVETALTAAVDFCKSKGCNSSRNTVQRTVTKMMGGAFIPTARTHSVKIDPSREDEVQLMNNKIEHVIDVLLDRFHKGIKENAPNASMIQLADAIARQRELQIKLLSLSPKKLQTTTSVDLGDGGGKIVLAQCIEHAEE